MKFDNCIAQLASKTYRRGINYNLNQMKSCLKTLGNPHQSLPKTIHIAGTNGKGSTLTFIAAGLTAAGYTIGTFTSPHITCYTERIAVDKTPIPTAEFSSLFHLLETRLPNFDQLTEFEVLTLMAILYFNQTQPDFCIFETGLGGRLDATNVIDPILTVITPISLDHEAILGPTIANIATEKAGIIKSNIPVISAQQTPDAGAVLQAHAARCRTPIEFVPPATEMPPNFTLNAPYQAQNLAVAQAAILHITGLNPTQNPAVQNGLKTATIFGRFQQIPNTRQTIILDAAHNLQGIDALHRALTHHHPNTPLTLIVGLQKNRSVQLIDLFLKITKTIYYCEFDPAYALPYATVSQHYPTIESWTLNAPIPAQNQLVIFSGSLYFLSGIANNSPITMAYR